MCDRGNGRNMNTVFTPITLNITAFRVVEVFLSFFLLYVRVAVVAVVVLFTIYVIILLMRLNSI